MGKSRATSAASASRQRKRCGLPSAANEAITCVKPNRNRIASAPGGWAKGAAAAAAAQVHGRAGATPGTTTVLAGDLAGRAGALLERLVGR